MATFLVRTERVMRSPLGLAATRRHGHHVNALLGAAGIPAEWIACHARREEAVVVDVIEAPDELTAQAAATVVALAHANLELAA